MHLRWQLIVSVHGAGKEYGKADSRYVTRDSFVINMEAVTAFVVGPMCFWSVAAMVHRKSWRHVLQLIISICQLYGDVLYFATTGTEGVLLAVHKPVNLGGQRKSIKTPNPQHACHGAPQVLDACAAADHLCLPAVWQCALLCHNRHGRSAVLSTWAVDIFVGILSGMKALHVAMLLIAELQCCLYVP